MLEVLGFNTVERLGENLGGLLGTRLLGLGSLGGLGSEGLDLLVFLLVDLASEKTRDAHFLGAEAEYF